MTKAGVVQKGTPLNFSVLEAMGNEEREFWQDFLEGVQKLLKDTPKVKKRVLPPELMEKYETAIKVHNGGQYCQIRQIQEIFNLV